MTLYFSQLDDSRVEEAFEVLHSAGEWTRQQGRRQRIAATSYDTYCQWQTRRANYVVQESNEIVGVVTLTRELLAAWDDYLPLGLVPMVRALATSPQHQGKGVGNFAMKEIIKACDQDPSLYLDCVSGFLPKYYERFGFESIAKQMLLFAEDSEPFDVTLMRRSRDGSRPFSRVPENA